MTCSEIAKIFTLAGLALDIFGVVALSWPLIAMGGLRKAAKEVAAKKKAAGKGAQDSTWLDADFGTTAERVLRDSRLAFIGATLVVIGFLAQLVGAYLSN